MELFWRVDNLQSLCKFCHDSIKARMEHGKEKPKRYGEDGWPIEE
jgi:hypothetical protein